MTQTGNEMLAAYLKSIGAELLTKQDRIGLEGAEDDAIILSNEMERGKDDKPMVLVYSPSTGRLSIIDDSNEWCDLQVSE